MSNSRIGYLGKTVYVGIDVHKLTYVITARCDGIIVKKASCPATPGPFVESIKRWFQGADIRSAYEAGFSGFGLHRLLVAVGIKNIVVNPSSIEIAANDRVKTDKRDSNKISEQLAAGRLTSIYIPTIEEELRRQLPRTRDQFVKARRRVGNQIKSKLFQFGFIGSDDKEVTSNKFLRKLEKLDLPHELEYCIGLLIDEWRRLTLKIRELNKAMAAQAENEPKVEVIYRSVPGIGPVSSRVLATELGDMSRFGNVKSLFAYTGLTPSEHTSGEKVRRGHISRQGNAWIRGVLIEVAWRAIDGDASLRNAYERIRTRRGGKIAIVAIARKLIGRIRACFKQDSIYQSMPVPS